MHNEAEMQYIMAAYSLAVLVGIGIGLVISCVMAYKCMKKRSARNQIKEQMQMKKHQFATQMGMSFIELDSRIHEPTVHL